MTPGKILLLVHLGIIARDSSSLGHSYVQEIRHADVCSMVDNLNSEMI